MIVLVTGATGVLGRRVAEELLSRAHAVRAMTRHLDGRIVDGATRTIADLETGEGLPDAVDGVDAIVHCATNPRPGRHRKVDVLGVVRLLSVAARSGSPHIVYPGIVGSDVIPYGYYRTKIQVEDELAGSGLPWSVVRATQYHQFVWFWLMQLSRLPVLPVPRDTRVQPLDPSSHARRLVAAVEEGPLGRAPDIGGAHAYEARDLARSYLAAVEKRKPVVRVTVPGIVGAALRAGGNLTPNRDDGGETWNDFVRRMIESGDEGRFY